MTFHKKNSRCINMSHSGKMVVLMTTTVERTKRSFMRLRRWGISDRLTVVLQTWGISVTVLVFFWINWILDQTGNSSDPSFHNHIQSYLMHFIDNYCHNKIIWETKPLMSKGLILDANR